MLYKNKESFSDFMVNFVIPLKDALEKQNLYTNEINIRDAEIRLGKVPPCSKTDGRQIAGVFPHLFMDSENNRIIEEWKVHWDTKIAPLFTAYGLVKAGSPPFAVGLTNNGKGKRLQLNIAGHPGSTKGLFIYPYNPKPITRSGR